MNKLRFLTTLLVIFNFGILKVSQADELSEKASQVAIDIKEQINGSQLTSIAVMDFVDLQNAPNELGRLIADEIANNLIRNSGSFSVIDRANLTMILEEHKLSASGLIDLSTAKELGKITGVDGVVVGTISLLGDTIRVSSRVISTETAKAIAAASVVIQSTDDLKSLYSEGIEINSPSGTSENNNKPRKSPRFKSDIIEAELDTIRPNGSMVDVAFTIYNKGKSNLEFGLTGYSYQDSNGTYCQPVGTTNSSVSSVSLYGYPGQEPSQLAGGGQMMVSINKLGCNQAVVAGAAKAQIEVGILGKYQGKEEEISIILIEN